MGAVLALGHQDATGAVRAEFARLSGGALGPHLTARRWVYRAQLGHLLLLPRESSVRDVVEMRLSFLLSRKHCAHFVALSCSARSLELF